MAAVALVWSFPIDSLNIRSDRCKSGVEGVWYLRAVCPPSARFGLPFVRQTLPSNPKRAPPRQDSLEIGHCGCYDRVTVAVKGASYVPAKESANTALLCHRRYLYRSAYAEGNSYSLLYISRLLRVSARCVIEVCPVGRESQSGFFGSVLLTGYMSRNGRKMTRACDFPPCVAAISRHFLPRR